MSIIIGIFEQGLIFAIMALGVYITYKILDFPDLSVDGTFPLGAAITAALITRGINPFLTLIASFLIGALAGMFTGIIHVRLKVRDLLSGLIIMTALYTINLRIAGQANLPIFSKETLFNNQFVNDMLPASVKKYATLILLLFIVVIMKFILDLYLKTKSGYLLRAVGDNSVLVTSLGKDNGLVKILGLSLANGFVALSGSIYCQQQGFFEITMGTGTMVMGLASVIIGMNLFKYIPKVKNTTAVIAGSIIYKTCVAIAIGLGLAASDLKLITSLLFLAILIYSRDKKRKVNANA
ncbi:MAG: ABC transporter permease [Clostridiales bacterium]|nr:ABC transporter permease [Clostridiales bacterium]